jgi:hypothetical protein
MSDEKPGTRSGGVNISGKDVKVGGGVYQSDKIDNIDNHTVNRSGGTNINAQGGTVSVSGDVVGRDKITTTTTTTTGIDAAALAELLKAFKDINRQIDTRKEDPSVDKDELKDTVKKVEAEVKKGEEANPIKVERWLKFLGDMAPDILQVTAATLANPVMGLSLAIKKIAEKAQSQAAA